MPDPLITLFIVLLSAIIIAGLFWPEKGLFWNWQRARKVTRRVLIEDALKHIHDCEYHNRVPNIQSLAGSLQVSINEISDLIADMQARKLLTYTGETMGLTPQGRDYALQVIRAHRLWERYLADKTGYPEEEWHTRSELLEHETTPAQTEALAAELGNPLFDPHGHPIPTATGEILHQEHHQLPNFPLDEPGLIVHLDDQPETVYAQLIAEGLYIGMAVRVTENTPQRVRFWANGDEHVLAPVLAANISVVPAPKEKPEEVEVFEPLSALPVGQTARVTGISRASRGTERRRLMDLGIVPGTLVTAEMVSPSGDPTAYLIRGTLIGLRKEQAGLIKISRELETEKIPVTEAVV